MADDARDSLWPLVQETREATARGLPMVALISALSLPSIASALSSPEGTSTRSTYVNWLVAHSQETETSAQEMYGLRCSLLHEGSAHAHRTAVRVVFTFPGTGAIHGRGKFHNAGEIVRFLDIGLFVEEMAQAVDRWLTSHGSTPTVQENLERFVRLRPEGLAPYVRSPVIA
jgi:hypothetical protein